MSSWHYPPPSAFQYHRLSVCVCVPFSGFFEVGELEKLPSYFFGKQWFEHYYHSHFYKDRLYYSEDWQERWWSWQGTCTHTYMKTVCVLYNEHMSTPTKKGKIRQRKVARTLWDYQWHCLHHQFSILLLFHTARIILCYFRWLLLGTGMMVWWQWCVWCGAINVHFDR